MSEKQDKETEKGEDPPREYRREASNDQVEITASDSMILTPASTSVDDIDDPQEITPSSDLSRTDRRICVVTTAALPWRTGTAVNPLLRALYLTRGRSKGDVTLLIPWLEDTKAQQQLYGQVFATENEQEEWIRTYCRDRCSCVEEERNLRVLFWKGSYHSGFGSIFPTEDIASLIPKEEADVAILEEPEHLNWWRIPPRKVETGEDAAELEWGWTDRFAHVVGVLHTNYGGYMKQYGLGTSFVTAPALNSLSALVVRAYCHRLVRLSGTLTSLDKDLEVTCNIHGVRDEFFQCPTESSNSDKKLAPVYFIGKIIWAKVRNSMLRSGVNSVDSLCVQRSPNLVVPIRALINYWSCKNDTGSRWDPIFPLMCTEAETMSKRSNLPFLDGIIWMMPTRKPTRIPARRRVTRQLPVFLPMKPRSARWYKVHLRMNDRKKTRRMPKKKLARVMFSSVWGGRAPEQPPRQQMRRSKS